MAPVETAPQIEVSSTPKSPNLSLVEAPPLSDQEVTINVLADEMGALAKEVGADPEHFQAAQDLLDKLKEYHAKSYVHSMRVTIAAVEAAKQLSNILKERGKCSGAEADQLIRDAFIAGLVHDVGKSNVPLEILDKSGIFDDSDYKIMNRHSVDGHTIITDTNHFSPQVAQVAGSHHIHQARNSNGLPIDNLSPLDKTLVDAVTIADQCEARFRNDGFEAPPDYLLDLVQRILKQDHYAIESGEVSRAQFIIEAVNTSWYEVRDRIEEEIDNQPIYPPYKIVGVHTRHVA